jgi:hypothetical protein
MGRCYAKGKLRASERSEKSFTTEAEEREGKSKTKKDNHRVSGGAALHKQRSGQAENTEKIKTEN